MTETATDATAQTEDKAPTEGTKAQDDQAPTLNDLLHEYEVGGSQQTTTQPAEPAQQQQAEAPAGVEAKVDAIVDYLKEDRAAKVAEAAGTDFAKVKAEVAAQIADTIKLSEDAIGRFINGRAGEDPRIQQAFAERHTNPAKWKQIQQSIGEELRTEFASAPDNDLTNARDAARASVNRQARRPDSATETPNTREMSDAEFMRFSDQQFAQNRRRY